MKKYCARKSRSVKRRSSSKSYTRNYCVKSSNKGNDSPSECIIGKTNQCVLKYNKNMSFSELEAHRSSARKSRRRRVKSGKVKGVSKCVVHDTRAQCEEPGQPCQWKNGAYNQYCSAKPDTAKLYQFDQALYTSRPHNTPIKEPAPTKEKTATPIKEKTATPTKEKTATPIKEPAPIKEKTATPIKEKTATPTKEKTATPTKEKTATPIKEKIATPIKEPAPIKSSYEEEEHEDLDETEVCDPKSKCCDIKSSVDCIKNVDCSWRNASIDKATGKVKVNGYCRNKHNVSKKVSEPETKLEGRKCSTKIEEECKELPGCIWVEDKMGRKYCRSTTNQSKMNDDIIPNVTTSTKKSDDSICKTIKSEHVCKQKVGECNWISERIDNNGNLISGYCRKSTKKK
jgi:hypothetical protein